MPIHIGNIGGGAIEVGTDRPLFTFSTISDIHLHDNNDDSGYDDLVNLFRVLGNRIREKDLNLRYICAAGDIGMNGPNKELATFSSIVNAKCPISNEQVFSCTGNHDQQHTWQEWVDYMFPQSMHSQITSDLNFVKEDGNFVFAFMSMAHQNDRSTTVNGRTCYLDESNETSGAGTKAWLRGVVEQARDKTLILFMHYPFQNRRCFDTSTTEIQIYDWVTGNYIPKTVNVAETGEPWAGLLDLGGSASSNTNCGNYGFYCAPGIQDYSVKSECEQIIAILNSHVGGKTIVFSGHTHLVFETERFDYVIGKAYPNVNVAYVRNYDAMENKYIPTNIVTVHIPSLNHPRKLKVSGIGSVNGWETISGANPYRQPCQSWLVDVYEDKLVLKGFETQTCHDKRYGDILEDYIYTIDLTDIVPAVDVEEEEEEQE